MSIRLPSVPGEGSVVRMPRIIGSPGCSTVPGLTTPKSSSFYNCYFVYCPGFQVLYSCLDVRMDLSLSMPVLYMIV